jgi:hypothetical protein
MNQKMKKKKLPKPKETPAEWLEKNGWMLVHCQNHRDQLASYRCWENHIIICAGCHIYIPDCPKCHNPFERVPDNFTEGQLMKERTRDTVNKFVKEKLKIDVQTPS